MIVEEQVQRILRLQGDRVPILSLYARLPDDPGHLRELRSRVDSLLSEVRPLTTDSAVDRDERLSVRADIERVEQFLEEERDWRPGTLVVFSCSAQHVFETMILPRPVRSRVVLDVRPWVRPMMAVLEEYPRLCAVSLERGEARLWELYQDEMREVGAQRGRMLTARRVPALEENRLHHKADELTKRHYRQVIGAVDGLFRVEGFDVLAVGGRHYETAAFVELLPRLLRERFAGTFALDKHPSEAADIRHGAMAVLTDHVREQQRRRVAEVVDLAAAGGRAALGLDNCLWAGVLAAIEALLVEEGAVAPGVVCGRCGWMAAEGTDCPQCGSQLRPVVDILNELADVVIDEGGSVIHVEVPTDLSKHRVAAALRFALPPRP